MTDPALSSPALQAFAGCSIQPRSLSSLFEQLTSRLATGVHGNLIGHHNLHSLYMVQKNATVARFYRDCCECYIDGMGALWLLRAAGIDTRGAQRFSLMDCLPDLLTLAEQQAMRVFYLGGSATSIERARNWIEASWPGLAVALEDGYDAENSAVLAHINAFAPDLLLVGMGMPRQEAWILQHREVLKAGVILQAGGTLDYYSGEQARPPAAWSRCGLAWLYRLIHNPRRLWRRYLVTPWSLVSPLYRLRRALAEQQRR